MGNKSTNMQKTAENGEKKQPKKRGFFRRSFFLLVIFVVVLGAAALSASDGGKQFASLRRWLMYGESGETQDLYTYASHQGNRFEMLGENLLLVNPNCIQILRQGGTAVFEMEVSMNAPLLSVGTEVAAVCDAGGSTVYVLDKTGLLWTHSVPDGLVCYSVRVSANDLITITEQKSGYKTSVNSYNRAGDMVFRFDSHDKYIEDAAMTGDGSALIAVSLEAGGGMFASELVLFDAATAQRGGTYPIRDGLVLDLAITGDRIIALCDKRLTITTMDGETVLNAAYGERYLHDYALTGADFCALLMGRYQSSNICQLVTYGLDGEELAALDLTEEVLDMNAAGNCLAVLFGDSMVIYDRTLTEIARLEGTDFAGHVRMCDDGTVLLAAETSAWRFLP